MSIQIGNQLPHFSSVKQDGTDFDSHSIQHKPVVIYFYPKDNTPGCTAQACNLRDNYSELGKNDIVILGASADDEKMHQKFITKFDLPFPLLSDVDHTLLNLYGVWGEKKFMGKIYDGIHRTTFIMDESHTIIEIIEKPKTKDHAAEILAAYNI